MPHTDGGQDYHRQKQMGECNKSLCNVVCIDYYYYYGCYYYYFQIMMWQKEIIKYMTKTIYDVEFQFYFD